MDVLLFDHRADDGYEIFKALLQLRCHDVAEDLPVLRYDVVELHLNLLVLDRILSLDELY